MVRHAVLLRRDRLLDDEADLGVHHIAAQSRTWQMPTLAGLADTDAVLNKGWIFAALTYGFVPSRLLAVAGTAADCLIPVADVEVAHSRLSTAGELGADRPLVSYTHALHGGRLTE